MVRLYEYATDQGISDIWEYWKNDFPSKKKKHPAVI